VPLVNMMLGEISPGGTGSGLYGMLIFALTSVFIAGLMVGRTPEYLGKKIQAIEMKLVVLYLLVVPIAILSFAGASVLLKTALSALGNSGPHGLTEMIYAFTSVSNNNGSAFAGLSGNTQWFNTTFGLCMLIGRFLLMVPVLAIAGSLARKQPVPHRYPPLRRAADGGGGHRRRADLLPRRGAGPHRRAPRRQVLRSVPP
jgi:K+-transporting ATPase ATPase A chain